MSQHYVRSILTAYLALPCTSGRTSPYDRRLARDLYDRGVPLASVKAAFVLACARRINRPPSAVPLGPVRSLAYFLPVLDEVLAHPIDPSYLDYLHRKLSGPASRPPT